MLGFGGEDIGDIYESKHVGRVVCHYTTPLSVIHKSFNLECLLCMVGKDQFSEEAAFGVIWIQQTLPQQAVSCYNSRKKKAVIP